MLQNAFYKISLDTITIFQENLKQNTFTRNPCLLVTLHQHYYDSESPSMPILLPGSLMKKGSGSPNSILILHMALLPQVPVKLIAFVQICDVYYLVGLALSISLGEDQNVLSVYHLQHGICLTSKCDMESPHLVKVIPASSAAPQVTNQIEKGVKMMPRVW